MTTPFAGRRLHFVGVAGAGMSGLALVARHLGADVTGSDRATSGTTIDRLRAAGIVEVQRGAGAGCRLARPPESITLREVYEAVEHEPLFGLHARPPNQGCPVGRGIQPALAKVYGGVEDAMRAELERTTVADLLIDVLASAWRTAVEPASDAPPGTPA